MESIRRLIFFVKSPEKGTVKTRLAAEVGQEKALEIYMKVTARSLNAVKGGLYGLRVSFFPPDAGERVSEWLGAGLQYAPQTGDCLGERMANAFRDAFSEGADRVLLIGSDIPGLERKIIEDAFASLDGHGAVINPTFDGGYCLIGFRKGSFLPDVFRDIKWSTGRVFDETMSVFAEKAVAVRVLPKLRDIDRAEDLEYFPGLLLKKKFSIIIPVLNEAENINLIVRHIRSLDGSEDCEIIVVDGSPDTDTLEAIEDGEVKKVQSEKGRGRQMNAGAEAAKSEILVFLHADTLLPDNAFREISEVFDSGNFVGGAFDLLLDSGHPFIRFVTWSAGLRSRLTRIPYGDQAIFIRREYFKKIGGYKEMALMEDVELMSRIKKRGGRICILKEPAKTSARKYFKDGIYYSAFRNHALRLLYSLGVPPEKLNKLYYR